MTNYTDPQSRFSIGYPSGWMIQETAGAENVQFAAPNGPLAPTLGVKVDNEINTIPIATIANASFTAQSAQNRRIIKI